MEFAHCLIGMRHLELGVSRPHRSISEPSSCRVSSLPEARHCVAGALRVSCTSHGIETTKEFAKRLESTDSVAANAAVGVTRRIGRCIRRRTGTGEPGAMGCHAPAILRDANLSESCSVKEHRIGHVGGLARFSELLACAFPAEPARSSR